MKLWDLPPLENMLDAPDPTASWSVVNAATATGGSRTRFIDRIR